MVDQTRKAFSLSNSDVGKVRGLGSKNRESKGMGYLELLADHTIGLDNEYESFGEKLGKEFNKDEIGFLKNMGTGVVKGAIEFASEPIKSTKEMYLELKSSANNLFKKSLTDRVGEMYNLSMEEASDEQVTAAREKIIGDAFIASGLIPSTKFIAEVAATGINTAAKQLQTADLSKLNKVMSKANEVAEEVEGRLNQSVLGSGYRAVAKEPIGKGKGADLPAATAAASNMGMVEKVFHITNDFDPNEEIFPGTMQWNPDEGVFNIPPDRKGEITTLKTPDEVALERASFQGITLKELIEKEGLDYLNNPKMAHDFLGVHVGTSKAAAARYSDNVKVDNILGEQKTVGATTQQLKVRTNKPFKDNGKPWTEKGLNTFLRKEMSKIKGGMVYEKMQVIRKQLAEAGFTHVPYINNVEDVLNISYVMLVDRPQGKGVNSSAVIRDRNAKFNPLDKAKRDQRLAQGGLIEMNNQTEMMLQEGGIADDGMKRDPVSGNEIPPGSMAKEVRDDVPANLSEGEYVVPADVVRFFGVKYFEDLRMQAKQGLLEMEKDGRIGGEPTPRLPAGAPPSGAGEISEEELMQILKEELGNAEPQEKAGPQPIRMMNKGGYASTSMSSYRKNFNEGGVVNAAEGVDVAPKYKPLSNTYGGANVGTDRGMTSVPYENASGDVMYFTFINGRLYPRGIKIPTGFNPMAGYEDLVPASLQTNPVDTAPAQTSEPAVVNNNDDMSTAEREALAETENGSTRWMDKFKLNSTTGTSATNTEIINSAKEILNSAGDSDFTIKGLSLLNPIAGVFGLAGRASSAAQVAGVLISLNDSMMKDEKGDPIKNAEWLSLKGQLDEFKTQYGLNKLPQEFLNGDMFAKQINTTINDLALSRNAIDLDGNPIFKNDAQWNNQMQSNAPTGMLYDSDTGEYNRDTDPFQDIQGVTKSVDRDDPDFDYNVFEITDKKAFEESGGIRPKLNPMTTGKTVTTKKVSANENPAPVVANSGDKDFSSDNEYYDVNKGGLITKRKKKKK